MHEPASIAHAHFMILKGFSSPFRHTYQGGKTQFRDLLCKEAKCSMLDAERMVDSLERSNKIIFQKMHPMDIYGIWRISGISP